MLNKDKISGFILAGGKSTRMGKDKGLIHYKGKELVQYSIDVLNGVCSDITICTNNNSYSDFGFPLLNDYYREVGPVGGIHSALKNTKSEWSLFVPCDSPYINKGLIDYILNNKKGYTAIIPQFKEKYYPTIALLHKSCEKIFEKAILKQDYKVLLPLFSCNLKVLNISQNQSFYNRKLLHNINTHSDLLGE